MFEGHGAATELLRVYKEALSRRHADHAHGARRSAPNWTAAGNAPLGPFIEAWAGWLGEPGLGNDWLKMSGLYVHIGRSAADDLRAPRPRLTPAGPASIPITDCRAIR